MPSSAVLAFEAALQRVSPETPAVTALSAADRFDSLIKAKKKAAASSAAPAATPMPENPTGELGRGTGFKDASFEASHPHLVHGGEFKLMPIKSRSAARYEPIGRGHKMWDHESMQGAEVYKVHNPLETVARIGHRQMQSSSAAELQGFENPNHPKHAAYIFKQISHELHPMTSQNAAHRAKRARGTHPQIAIRNVTSGNWSADNQYTESKDNPRTLTEHMARIRDKSTGQSSRHASNFTHSVVRAEMVTRGLNRMFDVARSMGKDFHGNMDSEAFHAEVMKRDLNDYSGRREIQGFHPEHLGSKHNPLSTGDFDKKGKGTWKPNPFFSRKKGEAHPMAEHLGGDAEKLNNFEDLANHMHNLPIGHGNSAAFRGKELVTHYLPNEASGVLSQRARMRGMKK